MYKLIIVLEKRHLRGKFDTLWPRFLHHAERMPGLRREATSHIEEVLIGDVSLGLVHELFFETLADLRQAMASPDGQAAGRLLQEIAAGDLSLMIADHKEDDIANLLKYRKIEDAA